MDYELINQEEFNKSFKNYLRDFYIYQFKENDVDFKINTTVASKSKKNKNVSIDGSKAPETAKKVIYDVPVPAATFSYEKQRLQTILARKAGVRWNDEEFVKRKKTECVTVNSFTLAYNPFHELYWCCNEKTKKKAGVKYAAIYSIILYLNNSNNNCFKNINKPISSEHLEEIREYFEYEIICTYCEKHHSAPQKIEKIPFSDKKKILIYLLAHPNTESQLYIDQLVRAGMWLNIDKESGKLGFIDEYVFHNKTALYTLFGYNKYEDPKMFYELLENMANMGILSKSNSDYGEMYSINNQGSKSDISCLLSKNASGNFEERFFEFLIFASNILPLGSVGATLLKRFANPKGDVFYRHNYLIRALNEYNLVDILYAIKNNKWLKIEYRNANVTDLEYQEIVCFPLTVRESTQNGRQYLVYYHPVHRSVSALRIDFIERIHLGVIKKEPKTFKSDLKNASKLLNFTQGVEFVGFLKENVKDEPKLHQIEMLIKVEGEKENIIRNRINREKFRHSVISEIQTEKYGKCIKVVVDAANTSEVIEWAKTFICRIVYLSVDGIESAYGMEISNIYNIYNQNNSFKNIKLRDTVKFLEDSIKPHINIFNEYLSKDFVSLGSLLIKYICECSKKMTESEKKDFIEKEISQNELLNDLHEYEINKNRFKQAERAVDLLTHERTPRFKCCSTSKTIHTYDILPLTNIERLWLKAIFESDFCNCFFSKEEREILGETFNVVSNDLFDFKWIEYFDQYQSVKNYYEDEKYCAFFKVMLTAIKNKNKVIVTNHSQYGKISRYKCSPIRFEYSKRDNIFRVYVVTEQEKIYKLNMERLENVEMLLDEHFDDELVVESINKYVERNRRKLVLLFDDRENVPDRILNEFSPWEKACEKWKNKTYKLTLFYDIDEQNDIVIRLLKYCHLVYIESDSGGVMDELKKRYELQLAIEKGRELRNIGVVDKETSVNEANKNVEQR